MAKRTLSNDSSCDAEIKRRPQPGLWRMKLSIQTTYGDVAWKHHVKGYVEMEVVEAPPPCTMTYIVVLDKSLSMMTGHRFSNTVQGFRVLNALLGQTMGGAEMIVIPFSNVLDKTYGPYRPPLPPDVVHDICNALRPKGGTDIELALNKAYELAEEIVERNAVTILMLTDGCDTGLQNKMVDYSHSVPLFRTMQAMSSKVFLCLVGICHDADAKLLGALAKMGNGTYTLTADSDIAGLMGSMVALVGERVHEQVALSLSLVHDDGQATLIMSDKAVCLSRAKPTRVPFTAGATTPFALHSSLYMSTMVVTSAVKNMQVVEQEDGLPEPDLECVLMDFERIALDHREAVAALKEVSEPLFQTIPNTTIMFYFRPKYSLT